MTDNHSGWFRALEKPKKPVPLDGWIEHYNDKTEEEVQEEKMRSAIDSRIRATGSPWPKWKVEENL